MSFHKNLKRLIFERDLKIGQVAKATGIKRTTLSDWLAGSKPRDLGDLRRLAQFFGLSLENMIFGGGNELRQSGSSTVDLVFDGPVRIRIERAHLKEHAEEQSKG